MQVRSARPFLPAMLATALVLSACSTEPGEDQVTLGTGQGQPGDPVTTDFRVFYTKRPFTQNIQNNQLVQSNVLQLMQFEPGADLYMRMRASPSATEVNLTAALTNNLGDVRDVDVNWDGTKVVFAMRFPFRANTQEEDQPASWDIYEYDITRGTVNGILVDPLRTSTDQPRYDDRFPHYLPDGRIVFTSTRQRLSQAILLDEGKQQFQARDENDDEEAFVLHVMDANGGNIRQISFNQSHDLDSAVLANGQIVFSRWDGIGAGSDTVSFYRINPDGSGLELLYGRQRCSHLATNGNTACTGANLPTPIQFLNPKQLQNGRVLAMTRPFQGTADAGDLISIDINNYVEVDQPTLPNAGVLTGPAHVRITPLPINTNPDTSTVDPVTNAVTTTGGSIGGRYRSAFPLADNSNRILVSWSQCQVIENNVNVPCTSQRLAANPPLPLAPPVYGIYIYNLNDNTQLPIVAPQAGIVFSDVVAAAPRPLAPTFIDRVAGVDYPRDLETKSAGIIDIKSVYDVDGVDTAPSGLTAVRNPGSVVFPNRPARFLRVEKAVSMPEDDIRDIRNTAFGPVNFMREILGYAPIEPDGSVRVQVPANVALQLSIVDQNARRISPLHRNWLQVRPGEVLHCNGCHTPQNVNGATQRSHGRANLFAQLNPGPPANGLFPNTDSTLMANPGETMAQARARVMCPLGMSNWAACGLSVNVIYNDVWTDPAAAGRAAEPSFDYCYTSGVTDVVSSAVDPTLRHTCASRLDTPTPVRPGCESSWNGVCRVVIHYLQHIQPLWERPRPNGNATRDFVCTSCHSENNAVMNAVMGTCEYRTNNDTGIRVPCGQLDLTNGADNDEPDHVIAYRRLLFAHNAQELNANMSALQDICLQRDPMTGVCIQFQVVTPSMLALNARGSRFFNAMNNATHTGMMTDAEKRLISEWLDIGAQYYNDPFLAPEN